MASTPVSTLSNVSTNLSIKEVTTEPLSEKIEEGFSGNYITVDCPFTTGTDIDLFLCS